MSKLLASWSHILRLVPGWEDATPGVGNHTLFWGRDPRFGHDVEVVRKVNSKVMTVELENAWNSGIESQVVDSVQELVEKTRRGLWLVKHPLGVSGRERIEVRDGDFGTGLAWAERVLKDSPLIVEPRIEITEEWSTQFEIESSGPKRLGCLRLFVDKLGQHRGHRLDAFDTEVVDDPLIHKAMEMVFAAGYRGPCGVDSYHGFVNGHAVRRPLGEINARMTFGRLALHLRDRVPTGPVFWWHPAASQFDKGSVAYLQPIRPDASPGVFRLPEFVDPGGLSGSVVVVGREDILRNIPGHHTFGA